MDAASKLGKGTPMPRRVFSRTLVVVKVAAGVFFFEMLWESKPVPCRGRFVCEPLCVNFPISWKQFVVNHVKVLRSRKNHWKIFISDEKKHRQRTKSARSHWENIKIDEKPPECFTKDRLQRGSTRVHQGNANLHGNHRSPIKSINFGVFE